MRTLARDVRRGRVTHVISGVCTIDAALPMANVKATGPPPLAAKPPCAGVGPCWPTCYAACRLGLH